MNFESDAVLVMEDDSFYNGNALGDPEIGPAQQDSMGQSTCLVQGGFAADQHRGD